MRDERLQEDFDQVTARLGLPEPEIPRKNVTRNRQSDYREYYTPEGRALVEDAYRLLLRRFGYSFDGGLA